MELVTLSLDSVEQCGISATCLNSMIGAEKLSKLPFSLRVVLENVLRNSPEETRAQQAKVIIQRQVGKTLNMKIPRVIMPDSTGVPILMDLAAMRDELIERGIDARKIDSRVKADLVVDHSLQVDASGSPEALLINTQREFERNSERYIFLKWAQTSFKNLTIHPPGSGIIHQLNLENIAPVVSVSKQNRTNIAFPDIVVGSDSHTPMVNALGVLGWGVGGIEAETVLLGKNYSLTMPSVVGVRFEGDLRAGVTTTDLALTLTERLRRHDLIGKFVEFFGPAVQKLSVPDRATLSNMAPEYGATVGFWPIDERTIEYLSQTARSQEHISFIEQFSKQAGYFRSAFDNPEFDNVIEIDLDSISPSIAGPSRPQDRIDLYDVANSFKKALNLPREVGGFNIDNSVPMSAEQRLPGHGAVVIAAITSCTNTTNPSAMVRAGLLAKRARSFGLISKPWVKTSLAPGSRVVTKYLQSLGLMKPLSDLGFDLVGYGCTTCGGKSGPLLKEAEDEILARDLVVVSVLSGNRNFSGRIHKLVQANYLGSPAYVVAYALAGRININWENEAIGNDSSGKEIFLINLMPSDDEVEDGVNRAMDTCFYSSVYGSITMASEAWDQLPAPSGDTYAWDSLSKYLMPPPFLKVASRKVSDGVICARILGLFGDSLTTDHVSPGGEIPAESPAGTYLQKKGVAISEFNTYVGRRGNHEVMKRATFANLRIQNHLTPSREGWWTRMFPSGEITTIYEAAVRYRAAGTPLIVIGGREYGTGSSRDWAAKGPALLGVHAVIALSFERIHRSNLAAMGIVPLLFSNSFDYDKINGSESITINGLYGSISPGSHVEAEFTSTNGNKQILSLVVDLRSSDEEDFILSGNVLKSALNSIIKYSNLSGD